mmetsp:Transcript_150298/g.418776  ORF Transcript_150298/g.418776 Transcript_150298/m.418776 type:complete len:203 (-) Transcript_150298:214-822(-)
MEDHAKVPHVCSVGKILAGTPSLGLGRHELRSASFWCKIHTSLVREAKVNQLHGRLTRGAWLNLWLTLHEEEVLGLEVPVHHAVQVQVPDGEEHLGKEHGDVVLGQAAVRDEDALQHIPALAKLEHQVNGLLLLKDLQDSDDIRVVQAAEDLGLVASKTARALHAKVNVLRPCALPVSSLDGSASPCAPVRRAEHAAVSALT